MQVIAITDEMEYRASAAAARWWADRLRDGAGIGDNGSDDPSSVMAMGLTYLIRKQCPITPEICTRFERILTEKLVDGFETAQVTGNHWNDSSGFDNGGVCLQPSVDYGPTKELYDALIEAGITENVAHSAALPLKTHMRVSARRVLVAHGYGARYVEIYGPVWGCSYKEQSRADNYRSDRLEKDCREPMEAEWVKLFGDKWTYDQIRRAGINPQLDDWKGAIPL